MASTTKMMTAILAIESGKLSDEITVTDEALAEGSSAGLKAGHVLTLESLVYGMMLESGNDAANVCALYLADSYEKFALKMNKKSKEIGMNCTNFVTPSGLDDERHFSTAYDMALLGAYCINNPVFREICSTETKRIRFKKPQITVDYSNHNRLLGTCEGVFGIKTGFTKKSGRCLVTACKRDGATLVCATLNAGDDWNDHSKLYDALFSELNKTTVKAEEVKNVPVYGADEKELEVFSEEFVYHFKDTVELTEQIILPEIIYAPVRKNEIIGKINYFSGENLVHTSYLYSKNDVDSSESSFQEKISFKDWIKKLFRKEDNNDRR